MYLFKFVEKMIFMILLYLLIGWKELIFDISFYFFILGNLSFGYRFCFKGFYCLVGIGRNESVCFVGIYSD